MPQPDEIDHFPPITTELSEFEVEMQLRDLRGAYRAGELDANDFHTNAFALNVRLGRMDRAIEHARQAHEVTANATTANNLGVAYLRVDASRAASVLSGAVDEYGGTVVLWCNLSEALTRTGRMPEAFNAMVNAWGLMDWSNEEHHFRFAHVCAVARYDDACAGHLAWYCREMGAMERFQSIADLTEVQFRRTPEVQASLDRLSRNGEAWLPSLYKTADMDLEGAEDLIHDWFDERFMVQQFEECNFALPLIECDRLPTELCLALLVATLPAADRLPMRGDLVGRVREILGTRLEDQARVEEILRHLG